MSTFPFTPEDVERAYAETGLEPARARYLTVTNSNQYACGLGALCAEKLGRVAFWQRLNMRRQHGSEVASEVLGIDYASVQGFIHGYDGHTLEAGDDPEAYAAGKAAAERVFGPA